MTTRLYGMDSNPKLRLVLESYLTSLSKDLMYAQSLPKYLYIINFMLLHICSLITSKSVIISTAYPSLRKWKKK